MKSHWNFDLEMFYYYYLIPVFNFNPCASHGIKGLISSIISFIVSTHHLRPDSLYMKLLEVANSTLFHHSKTALHFGIPPWTNF